jgi:hypothetical protein
MQFAAEQHELVTAESDKIAASKFQSSPASSLPTSGHGSGPLWKPNEVV